jgi:hypothetical protein
MQMKDNGQDNDKALKAYLEGSDGVSAAYRQLGAEEPPAGLDAAIRRAAAQAVAMQPAAAGAPGKSPEPVNNRTSNMPGLLSLAASLVAGVLIGVVVMDQGGTGFGSQPEMKSATAEAGAVAVQLSDEATGPATAARSPEVEQPLAVSLDNLVQVNGPQGAAPASESRELAATPPRDVIRLQSARQAEPAVAAASDTVLEEVILTGSRVRTPEEAIAYRSDQAEWLAAMAEMRQNLQDTRNREAGLAASLEEELQLFMQQYPDVDLDTALDALSAPEP